MKHCVYCGEILNDDASFCTKCGKSVAILKENIKVEENKKQKSGIGFGVASICCFVIPILSFVFAPSIILITSFNDLELVLEYFFSSSFLIT